ncbi:MAG: hypothetical protein R3C32_09335 [Chloroflexota bacterium]
MTGFRQDIFPFARDDFWYTFQGISADGRWYVAVDWVLRASGFPARISNSDAERVGRNGRTWRRYIDRTVATLDAAAPTDFTPSLDTLDALVRSIDFESVAAPPPSPVPSLAPQPSPAPTGTDAGSAAPANRPGASSAP